MRVKWVGKKEGPNQKEEKEAGKKREGIWVVGWEDKKK